MKTSLSHLKRKKMLNGFKKITIVLLILASSIASVFGSSILVYPMTMDLTLQNRYQDVQIQNTGNDTAYVAISIYRVNNPGMQSQSFTALNDNPYQVGLIVTPNKMIIPEGQMRIARILYIGSPISSDAIYEVKFTPVSGQLIAVGNNQGINAGVELIIAYGASVIVRPANLQPNVIGTRQGTNLILNNTGNTTVLIGNCQQCNGSHCQKVINLNLRLYPNNTGHFALPQALPVQCQEEVLQNQFLPFNIS